MSSLIKDFVTGSDACVVDGAGPSNAAASFADAFLGGRSKQQERLHELPGRSFPGPSIATPPYAPPTSAQAAEAALYSELPTVPGLAPPTTTAYQPQRDVDAFLQGYSHPDPLLHEFEGIYGAAQQHQQQTHLPRDGSMHSQLLPSPPQAIAPFLQAFFDSGKTQAPFLPRSAAPVDLSVGDKCRIRDRSTILARHVFADRGNQFADEQVSKLLSSLNIDPSQLPVKTETAAWDRIYADTAVGQHAAAQAAAAAAAARPVWVEEFENLRFAQHGKTQQETLATPSSAWATEYNLQQQPQEPVTTTTQSDSWAEEYKVAAESGSLARQAARDTVGGGDALQETRRLAETLSANKDPKFQNSKFLQFVSKMSRGEIIMEDNQVKEVPRQAQEWINEFTTNNTTTTPAHPSMWGDEFASFQANQHPHLNTSTATAQPQQWAEDFAQASDLNTSNFGGEDWAEQFAQGVVGSTSQWAEEFTAGGFNNADGDGATTWEEEYLKELEYLHSSSGPQSSGAYIMSEDNPFLLDIDSYSTGKELFRRGLLSEAVLALEAECQRNPQNSEAWRLLGTVQAENDDDQQAIAAMNRALAAYPDNLEVLLSLGVSHTNELDQHEALIFLRQWLLRHNIYGQEAKEMAPPLDTSQILSHTLRMFAASARTHPEDADIHVALGVLANLARRYDEAIAAFQAALTLRPTDYSLWNKLGATLANSGRSGEAIASYQKALDLKPNYMRAWTNMGISLANLGDYEGSARYYVRALSLNPKADAVWGYLTTTMACLGGLGEYGTALEGKNVQVLADAFPL